MAYEQNNNEKQPTPATGITGTVLGGTALAVATGILNGGLGGLFGNNNPAANPVYQLAQKDAEIVQLKAEKYADAKVDSLTKEVSVLSQRVAAIEVAEPLREQIIMQNVNSLQNTINRLVQPMIPNGNVAPGWGPSFVTPFPPPVPTFTVTSGGSSSSTPATTTTAQAA